MNLKEILIGTPQERAAVETVRKLESKAIIKPRERDQFQLAKKLTRRRFLRQVKIGAVGVVGLAIGGAYVSRWPVNNDSVPYTPEPLDSNFFNDLYRQEHEVWEHRQGRGLSIERPVGELNFNVGNIIDNFNQLYTAEAVDRNAAAAAIKQNVRTILLTIKDAKGNTGYRDLTALRINNAGIYLTVAHGIEQNQKLLGGTMIDLVNGKTFPITHYVQSNKYDFAFIGAPTGEVDSLPQNLRASRNRLTTGQHLWQYAQIIDKETLLSIAQQVSPEKIIFTRAILSGTVDNPPEEFRSIITNNPLGINDVESIFRNRTRVRGMIPFGGSSGAPVFNKNGELIAVESGPYPGAGDRVSYQGATVIGLEYLISGLQNSTLIQF